jgi:glutathione S-transferase
VVDFYFGKNSGNAARTALALYEVGVPFVAHPLDLRKPRSPEYLAVNPVGKVPALIDGAATLWESNAINWYLADKYQQAGLLRASPEGRADVLRWAFFQASHVRLQRRPFTARSIPRTCVTWLNTRTLMRLRTAARSLRATCLSSRARSRMRTGSWVITLSPTSPCAPHLGFLVQYGFDFPGTPRVRAWLERIRARPAWQKAHALIFDGYAP